MKFRLFTAVLLFVITKVSSQEKVTIQQWQDDVRFFQKKVNKEFSFLFKKVTAKDFNKAADELHKNIPNLQEHEIIVGFSRLVSLFKYGHTYVNFHQKPFEFSQFPFNLYQFNDGIYIQGVHQNYSKALGARVIKVEGKPISDVLKVIEPTVEAENTQFFKAWGINNIRYPEVLHAQRITNKLPTTITLTLEKNGKKFQQDFSILQENIRVPTIYGYVQSKNDWLSARNQSKTPLYLQHLNKNYYYKYLSKQKTVYVRHSSFFDDKTESTEAFYNRVFKFIEGNNVKKLVIDVRLNGGGNNFLVKPIITKIIETKKINKKGKLFVITGRRTFSACQNFVNRLDSYTNAIFVGEPTSENVNFYGDAKPIKLPNSKLKIRLSFAWWQDKAPWENEEWLSPQLSVDMSFEEYKNNEDPVLEAIFSFNPDDFIVRPMEHIRTLFMQGKTKQLQNDIAKMMNDSRYKFFNFKTKFTNSGKLLMNQEQYQLAIGVFSLIAKAYPNSATNFKNLGDCYFKLGHKLKAEEFYVKALGIK